MYSIKPYLVRFFGFINCLYSIFYLLAFNGVELRANKFAPTFWVVNNRVLLENAQNVFLRVAEYVVFFGNAPN